jgi:aspartate carbamoyltransferase
MGINPLIKGNFKNKSILSINQFDTNSLLTLFKNVPKNKKLVTGNKIGTDLKGRVVCLLFFEPSSRTFSSFATAVKRLGGQTLEFEGLENTSVKKGESFKDTIKTFSTYSNALVVRHPEKFAPQKASEFLNIPIINAGDGSNEHPTQTLLDLYTIYEKFGKLSHLTGVFAGDLLNGRTVHSLLKGLSMFGGNTIYLLSPKKLRMPLDEFKNELNKVKVIEINKASEIPTNANFWYWTRVQKERFSNVKEYEKLKHSFVLSKKLLDERGNKNLILMHPLPRVGEIDEEVDEDARALYFRNQIENGLYVRMALLSLILKK